MIRSGRYPLGTMISLGDRFDADDFMELCAAMNAKRREFIECRYSMYIYITSNKIKTNKDVTEEGKRYTEVDKKEHKRINLFNNLAQYEDMFREIVEFYNPEVSSSES